MTSLFCFLKHDTPFYCSCSLAKIFCKFRFIFTVAAKLCCGNKVALWDKVENRYPYVENKIREFFMQIFTRVFKLKVKRDLTTLILINGNMSLCLMQNTVYGM